MKLSDVLTIDHDTNEIIAKNTFQQNTFSNRMFLWFHLIDKLKRIPTDEWLLFLKENLRELSLDTY